MLNPEISRLLIELFGEKRSRYLASELEVDVTVGNLRRCLMSKTPIKDPTLTTLDYPNRLIDRINC